LITGSRAIAVEVPEEINSDSLLRTGANVVPFISMDF
jgi:hypothetical protein